MGYRAQLGQYPLQLLPASARTVFLAAFSLGDNCPSTTLDRRIYQESAGI